METVRKMMLVPAIDTPDHHRLYQPVSSALQQPEKAHTQRTIYSMDNELRAILDDPSLADYEKHKLYSAILQQRSRYQDKLIQPIPVPVTVRNPEVDTLTDTNSENDIIHSLPVGLQGKARRIIQSMKDNPEILTWNKDWRLVYDGKPVPGTNIADLIADLVHDAKTAPAGWKTMMEGLKRVNLPEVYIENKARKEALKARSTKFHTSRSPKRSASSSSLLAASREFSPVASRLRAVPGQSRLQPKVTKTREAPSTTPTEEKWKHTYK